MGMSKTDFTRKAMGNMQTKRNKSIKVTDAGTLFYIERIQQKRTSHLRENRRLFNG